MAATREDCLALDARDALAPLRDAFELPPGVLYFDGNSLGPLPRGAGERVRRTVEHEWGAGLIRSWNAAGWFELPRRLGDRLAPLVGAGPGEVVVTDTTSINLYKVLGAALSLRPGRRTIVSERDNFPTDLYIAQGLAETLDRGHALRLVERPEALESAIDADTAVLLLTHVNYRTGRMHDMTRLSTVARERGALSVWDLAHSAGALPVDLSGSGADFAVGCTYKYLNGGPGAPAFLWVAPRHHDAARVPLTGWWGHAAPFAMRPGFEAQRGIGAYLCGTQPVVSLALVECGLEIFERAGLDALRVKSLALSDLFIALVESRCTGLGLTLVTPRAHAERGSQVSFAHAQGYPVMQALIERGVIGDYRDPGILRFGLAPLYTRFVDVWDAVETLREVLATRAWDAARHHQRRTVT